MHFWRQLCVLGLVSTCCNVVWRELQVCIGLSCSTNLQAQRLTEDCISAANPVATAFELQHYFEVAQPTIIAADTTQLEKVELALKTCDLRARPKIVLIDDGSQLTLSQRLPSVCTVLL